MNRIMNRVVLGSGAVLLASSGAFGQLGGSAIVTPTPGPGAGVWTYAISVNNTGTTPIGTLWFAWIPGQNYLFSTPSSISSPAGWTSSTFGSGSNVSVRWTASGTATDINAGNSLGGFSFISTMSPTQMASNSPNFNVPVTTSFFYSGAAFSDAGFRFVAPVVPTPSAAAVGLLGLAVVARRRR
jgi:uncharacterized protein (TIGR03382 family)